jgi:aminomethyltransferase
VEGGFLGAGVILPQLAKPGAPTRRVGLVVEGPPAREGAVLYDAAGTAPIGTVTSGCPSPVLKQNIAMGYVTAGFQKAGTPIKVLVRERLREAHVVRLPFVPHRYYK